MTDMEFVNKLNKALTSVLADYEALRQGNVTRRACTGVLTHNEYESCPVHDAGAFKVSSPASLPTSSLASPTLPPPPPTPADIIKAKNAALRSLGPPRQFPNEPCWCNNADASYCVRTARCEMIRAAYLLEGR